MITQKYDIVEAFQSYLHAVTHASDIFDLYENEVYLNMKIPIQRREKENNLNEFQNHRQGWRHHRF